MPHWIQLKRYWQSAGYEVQIAENIGSSWSVFAGDIPARVAELQRLLDAPEIRAIHFARGGYGAHQILSQLDWSGFLRHPKWLIGFSDVTLLLCKVLSLGYQCVHGQMASGFSLPQSQLLFDQLIQALERRQVTQPANLEPSQHVETVQLLSSPDTAATCWRGTILGGNLSLLQTTLGTPLQPHLAGSILFIEEVSEYLYAFERALYHLEMSGLLRDCEAIFCGGLHAMQDNPERFHADAKTILTQFATRLRKPLFYSEMYGHGGGSQPLILGAQTCLAKSDNGTWTMQNVC